MRGTGIRHQPGMIWSDLGRRGINLKWKALRTKKWSLQVTAYDYPGAAAAIAGLITAHGCEVISGDMSTVSRQRSGSPVPVLIDTFEIRSSESRKKPDFSLLQKDLENVFSMFSKGQKSSALEYVFYSLQKVLKHDGGTRLFPIDVKISNRPQWDFTELRVRSKDAPGFLFAFSNALTAMGININSATLATRGGEVDDRFQLTDAEGKAITDKAKLDYMRAVVPLMKQFSMAVPQSANPKQALSQFVGFLDLLRSTGSQELESLASPKVMENVAAMMGASQFLWEDFLRMQLDSLVPVLVDPKEIKKRKQKISLQNQISRQLTNARGYSDKAAVLNEFKDKEMFRIDLRHIIKAIDFVEFSDELTDLADVVISEAVKIAFAKSLENLEIRQREEISPGWGVFGLGKLGGRELGFASDIEVIFVYDSDGATKKDGRIAGPEFFNSLVYEFSSTLKSHREGIFEIDLRLRPYGKAGNPASSLKGFGEYYSANGSAQQFERMALTKLRYICGSRTLADEVESLRDRFVYSGAPVDYTEILHLRHRQATELVPPGTISAKYSRGGLVDIEYYIQYLQIVAGAKNSRLRLTNCLHALEALSRAGEITSKRRRQIHDSYTFLRRLIDALRVVRGHAKDLSIPGKSTEEFKYLTRRLGFQSERGLQAAIKRNMAVAEGLLPSLATN